MRNSASVCQTGGLLVILAAGLIGEGQPVRPQAVPPKEEKEREADREAIRKSSADFATAFEKGDAKTIASFWTDQGEYRDDAGEVIRGRAAIEKTYAEFFKAKPKSKVEVDIRSIRFVGRDTAIEDGVLRQKPAGAELPTSTRYSALHVREDGRWKIAAVHESGAAEDKLDDIAWLIGRWTAKTKDRELDMTYEWNTKKTQVRNHFTVKEGGKVTVSGTQTIASDPQTGQLRSWLFDDDGGHGQSLWFRDGQRWVQDSRGVLHDGRDTAATNIITRLNDDEFVWRSTHRMIGPHEVPDAAPVKLTRVKADK